MALAQELVDLIVDNIHDDIPSLKSCSMAAHTFVHSCRTHLFKKIRFNPPDNPFSLPSCQKFYRLLSSSPHIAPLVEDLCIVTVLADRPSDLLTHFNGECMRERNISWITADTTLALVLPLLNLKRISLLENATADCRIYSMNWSKMERPLKSALTSVFSSPRLEAVHIRGIVIESPVQLLSLFSEATGLKEMSLSRLCFRQKDRSESWPESQLWRPQLQSLLVSASGSPLSCRFLVNPQIHLGHIRTLTVARNLTEMNKIVPAAKGVDRLRLVLYDGWTREYLGTNLRSLHLSQCRSILAMLGAVLETCPPDTRLEHITVEGHGSTRELPSHAEFAAIDVTGEQLRALKTINLCWIKRRWSDTFTPWEAVVQAALPSLIQRGMLRVTESPTTLPNEWNDVIHEWE